MDSRRRKKEEISETYLKVPTSLKICMGSGKREDFH